MSYEELMKKSVEKVLEENSWESVEWLFGPTTQFELLLRLDLKGMKRKVADWFMDDSPSAMPHRHRDPYNNIMNHLIKREEFYRELKRLHEQETVDVGEE